MQYKEMQNYIENNYGDRYILENNCIRAKNFEAANRLLFGSTHGYKNIWATPQEIDPLLVEKTIEKSDKLFPILKALSKYIDIAEIDIAQIESNGNATVFFQHLFPAKLSHFPHRRKMMKTLDGMNKFVLGTVIEFDKNHTPIDCNNVIEG